jgi:galactokinase
MSEEQEDCHYCERLQMWGNNPAMTRENIDKEYFMRVAGMTLATRRLEELGEDVSCFPRIMTYDMADAINDHHMYGEVSHDAPLLPPAPVRLHRCNAGYSEIHRVLQTARNYRSDVRSFQHVFGFSSELAADRRKDATVMWAKMHPSKKV